MKCLKFMKITLGIALYAVPRVLKWTFVIITLLLNNLILAYTGCHLNPGEK